MTHCTASLACDHYRFLGVDIAVHSNAPAVLEPLRIAYGRFLVPGDPAAGATPPARVIQILEDEDDSRHFRMEDGEWDYNVFDEHGEAQFERCPAGSAEPDLTGFADLPTVFRAALLDTLGRLLKSTPYRLFHSGAVTYKGSAVLIPAASGMGKTTLVVKLLERGCHLLSDELTCIDTRNHFVVPFPRRMHVREHSMRLLGLAEPAALSSRVGYTGEREWTFDAERLGYSHDTEARPPAAALFLRGFGDRASLAPLSTARALFDFVPFHIGTNSGVGPLLVELAPIFERLCCRSVIVGTPDETADLAVALFAGLDAADTHSAVT